MSRYGTPPGPSKSKLASVALTKKEKRRQTLTYAALGALGGPTAAAAFNLITRNTPLPPMVKSVPRWLLGSAAAGAITSGAIPTIQRQIGDSIQAEAAARVHRAHLRAERRSLPKLASVGRLVSAIEKAMAAGMGQRATNAGMGAALGALIGPVASTMTGSSDITTETVGRDMMVGAISGAIGGLAAGPGAGALTGMFGGGIAGMFDREKKASMDGQDLRLPVMGGTKFPTNDSVGSAASKLQQSSAEVGPQPKPSFQMKKASLGEPMDPMMDDPLVLFLKTAAVKEDAKEQPPLSDLLNGTALKDNIDDLPLIEKEPELASKCPCPTSRMESRGTSDVKAVASELFENAATMRRKSDDKEHPFEGFDQGVVDRVLGL